MLSGLLLQVPYAIDRQDLHLLESQTFARRTWTTIPVEKKGETLPYEN
jgi:hypothetical protein